jgi:hypothetical protein
VHEGRNVSGAPAFGLVFQVICRWPHGAWSLTSSLVQSRPKCVSRSKFVSAFSFRTHPTRCTRGATIDALALVATQSSSPKLANLPMLRTLRLLGQQLISSVCPAKVGRCKHTVLMRRCRLHLRSCLPLGLTASTLALASSQYILYVLPCCSEAGVSKLQPDPGQRLGCATEPVASCGVHQDRQGLHATVAQLQCTHSIGTHTHPYTHARGHTHPYTRTHGCVYPREL